MLGKFTSLQRINVIMMRCFAVYVAAVVVLATVVVAVVPDMDRDGVLDRYSK